MVVVADSSAFASGLPDSSVPLDLLVDNPDPSPAPFRISLTNGAMFSLSEWRMRASTLFIGDDFSTR